MICSNAFTLSNIVMRSFPVLLIKRVDPCGNVMRVERSRTPFAGATNVMLIELSGQDEREEEAVDGSHGCLLRSARAARAAMNCGCS